MTGRFLGLALSAQPKKIKTKDETKMHEKKQRHENRKNKITKKKEKKEESRKVHPFFVTCETGE